MLGYTLSFEDKKIKYQYSFGIGCFNFGVKKNPPFVFDGKEYIKELYKTLESISNIKNINIYSDELLDKFSTKITEELPKLENGISYFPRPLMMKIEFEVFIPFRIQQQLLGEDVKYPDIFTEEFKVLIEHNYHYPVTIIESVNPTEANSPSSAVEVIREFLEKEINNGKSDYIRFEYIGPSPFHADFYISLTENQSNNNLYSKNQFQIIHRKGYDSIIFSVNSKEFPTIPEAKHSVYYKIQDELSFFYYLIGIQNEKIFHWDTINSLIKSLIYIQKTKGMECFFKRIFTRSKIINEAFISLMEFESNRLYSNNATQREYKSLYFDSAISYLKFYIDREIKEQYTYPIRETNQLINFFESQRFKTLEIITILVSAIIGGVIGSLLTIILSSL